MRRHLGDAGTATGGELLLVAVHPEPLVVLPAEIGWTAMRKQAEEELRQTRDELAPGARVVVETDWSVPRALERVVGREHRNLLVMGSSRRGPVGRVRIGKRTRQLLCHFRCALAVAPEASPLHQDAVCHTSGLATTDLRSRRRRSRWRGR